MLSLISRRLLMACTGGAIVLSISRFAFAEDSSAQQNRYVSPIERAGDFGRLSPSNIGIMVYYGHGNEVTKEQVGEFVVDKIVKRAQLRNIKVSPQYFIAETDWEGIAVGYHVGAISIDSQDLRSAVELTALDEVLDIRMRTASILE